MSPLSQDITISPSQELDIPTDLQQQANNRFNQLLTQGQIVWQPYDIEDAEDQGFKVQFQTAPHLRYKPHNPLSSVKKAHDHGNNPFMNPDPAFVLARPGPEHTLILNRYPVYRNSLLIHTNKFKLQNENLDEADLTACWRTLKVLTTANDGLEAHRKRWVMIYNCGYEAGSSQAHKHMQLWPVPPVSELGFELFPYRATSEMEIMTLSDIPFQHFILRLPQKCAVKDVATAHARLLAKIESCHTTHGSVAYNVAMSRDWLMMVPRRNGGGDWHAGGNTAAMLGLLWINGPAERARWVEYGIAKHMARLGVPNIGARPP